MTPQNWQTVMTKKGRQFFRKKSGWHPQLPPPGDTHPNDATAQHIHLGCDIWSGYCQKYTENFGDPCTWHVDLKSAFDSIVSSALWEALRDTGVEHPAS